MSEETRVKAPILPLVAWRERRPLASPGHAPQVQATPADSHLLSFHGTFPGKLSAVSPGVGPRFQHAHATGSVTAAKADGHTKGSTRRQTVPDISVTQLHLNPKGPVWQLPSPHRADVETEGEASFSRWQCCIQGQGRRLQPHLLCRGAAPEGAQDDRGGLG